MRMILSITLALAVAAAVLAYLRLAPSNPALWHIALEPRPPALGAPAAQITALEGGAYVDVPLQDKLLAQLDAIAMATPRTQRLAGSVASGHITWITRSALWGFPDYTTAQITPNGLTIYARLRFGRSDLGVNAARLRKWLAALQNGANLS
jgi:uncharacterized protein (DUF1499 family)